MDKQEINLTDIIYHLFKNWKTILLAVCIGLLLSWGYASLTRSDEGFYYASASMVINTRTFRLVEDGFELVRTNDVYLAQRMVNTYRIILLSDTVMGGVADQLGLSLQPEQIRSLLSITASKDTEVILVSVRNSDPQLAADIANALMAVAPGVINQTVEIGTVKVLDQAAVPTQLVYSTQNIWLVLAIGATLGLLTGVLLVVLLSFLFPRLKNKEQMADVLGIECLGEIPYIKKHKGKLLVTSPSISPQFAENFKFTAERILYACEQAGDKILMFTSAGPEEGKTTVSLNVAISLVKTGKKVLYIDCDPYKEGVRSLIRLRPKAWLYDVLSQDATWQSAVCEDPQSGLHLIFSQQGRLIGLDRLNAPVFRQILSELAAVYDSVIIDTPPALIQTDAVSLAKLVDSVVMVIKQEAASLGSLREVKNKLTGVGAVLAGGIINSIRFVVATEYYGQYSYASQYSGYQEDRAQKRRSVKKKVVSSALFLLMVGIIVYFNTHR